MELLTPILQAIGLFVATNIDDIIVLSLFYARGAGQRGTTRKILLGQYLGFGGILLAAVVISLGARSFLPEDQPRGDPLHVFVERVGARLGAGALRTPVPQADHRPECRQRWQAAEQALPGRGVGPGRNAEAAPSVPACVPGPLDPAWLLRPPQPLAQQQGRPVHQGRRLRLIAGPRRIESGWWSGAVADDGPEPPVARDYFIAQGAAAELLWVYRERPTSASAAGTGAGDRQADAPRWFLHGLYA